MTDPNTVAPDWSGSPTGTGGTLRLQGTSRLAFGATTAALVTLASGGTALVVNHSTSSLASITGLPRGSLLVDGASAGGAVVVDPPATAPVAVPSQPTEKTEQALRSALAQRTAPGRRTLTAPLVSLPGVVHPTPPAATPAPAVGEAAPVATPVVSPPSGTGPTGGFQNPRTPHSPLPLPSSTAGATEQPPIAGPTAEPSSEPTSDPTADPPSDPTSETATTDPATTGPAANGPAATDPAATATAEPTDAATTPTATTVTEPTVAASAPITLPVAIPPVIISPVLPPDLTALPGVPVVLARSWSAHQDRHREHVHLLGVLGWDASAVDAGPRHAKHARHAR